MAYDANQQNFRNFADDMSCYMLDETSPPPSKTGLKRSGPAIESALSEHYKDFRRYLMRRVGDLATAEDILQNFCERALKNNSALRNNNSAVAWLYTVLKSALTDHFRRESVRKRGEASYAEQRANLGEDVVEYTSPSEFCGCAGHLVHGLRDDYAEILARIDMRDESRGSVGRELNISPDNLRVRLHRARKAMFESLKSHCGPCCDARFDDCFCATSPDGQSVHKVRAH